MYGRIVLSAVKEGNTFRERPSMKHGVYTWVHTFFSQARLLDLSPRPCNGDSVAFIHCPSRDFEGSSLGSTDFCQRYRKMSALSLVPSNARKPAVTLHRIIPHCDSLTYFVFLSLHVPLALALCGRRRPLFTVFTHLNCLCLPIPSPPKSPSIASHQDQSTLCPSSRRSGEGCTTKEHSI